MNILRRLTRATNVALLFISMAFVVSFASAQEATPVDIKFRYRGGGCFDENHVKGRNENAMVECGSLKGRVQFGLIGVSVLGFYGQFINMTDLVFIKVQFANTRFELAKVEKTNFVESQITDSDWRGIQLRGVHFTKSAFQHVDLRGAKLSDVTFTDCNLNDVNLEGATLFRVNFKNTKTENLKLDFVSKNLVSGLTN